jgi:glycerophosphoryl diester phosphodiesterase
MKIEFFLNITALFFLIFNNSSIITHSMYICQARVKKINIYFYICVTKIFICDIIKKKYKTGVDFIMFAAKIQAHRGASAYRPENTAEAFSLALEQGADGIELDVHLTKDGHIVVAHDERLERVSNGAGLINDHTLEELKALNFNKPFPGQAACIIPTLGEVYSLIKETAATVNVELKTTELLYPGLPEKLIAAEHEYSMQGRVIYSSFNHYSLAELKKIEPSVKTGLLYAMGMLDPWVYANYVGAYAIHPPYQVIAALPETVAKCHENGIMVNVWTIDDPKIIGYMYQCGADAVITNKPDIAFACRESMNK